MMSVNASHATADQDAYDAESDALIRRFVDTCNSRGDRHEAATALFQRHRQFVIQRLRARLGMVDPETVADLSQEIWMSLLSIRSLKGYEPRGRFRGYLHRSVDFKIGEWRRRKCNTVTHEAYDDFTEVEVPEQADVQAHQYEEQENVSRLRAILARISGSLRVVVLLECYHYVFQTQPVLPDVCSVMGLDIRETQSLLSSAEKKQQLKLMCDREKAVWISFHYDTLLREAESQTHADLLGVSAGSYRTRLARARAYIRESLQQ